MKNSTSNISQLLESFPTSLFILDYEGNIIDSNHSALNFIAESDEQIVKKNFRDFIEDEQKIAFDIFIKKINETPKNQTEEFNVKSKGGHYTHTFLSGKNIEEFNDYKNLISLTLFDLTFQHMQAVFIKESQTRFENIANSAPVMIWISDVNGLFSFVNNVWCEFTGKKMGNELGLNWLKNVHPDHINELLSVYKTSLDKKCELSTQFKMKNKIDEYKWIMMVGTLRFDQKNNFLGLIGTCIDISKQKENEEKIEKINAELAEINATKDKFFSIISHDLRSPLSGLMGILEIISDGHDSLEEESKQEIIKESFISAKNIYKLLENLLEWSQVQTGKIKYEPQNFQLLTLAKDVTGLYTQNLNTKGIQLEININPSISVFADRKITETVLRNLISNAIKFTPTNGLIIISAQMVENSIKISVQDSGVGMNKERLDKLFKIEFTHSTKGTAKEVGTGLGLILCKELVEKQNGKIWAESEVRNGSTFFFTLKKSN
jgi:PAS domain S-box-containing protein